MSTACLETSGDAGGPQQRSLTVRPIDTTSTEQTMREARQGACVC